MQDEISTTEPGTPTKLLFRLRQSRAEGAVESCLQRRSFRVKTLPYPFPFSCDHCSSVYSGQHALEKTSYVQARSSNRSPPSQVAYPCPVGLCCKWSPPSQGQADRAGKTTCPTPSVCSLSRSLRVTKWAFSHQEPGQPGGRRQVTSYPTGANRPQLRARPSVRKRRRPTSLGCSFGDDWAGRADLDQG